MDVSVVIATYNRKILLEKSVECLFCQNYPEDKYEIVVVDDGSTDGTEKMVKEKTSPCRLKYLQHNRREGPSKARNFGISKAEGNVIIFIDSDILVPPQFISEHMRFHKKYENIIVDGPAINTQRIEGVFNNKWGKLLAFFDFFGASFITANTSCRKENLIKVGLFDEDFGRGFGWFDRELGFRLKQIGLRRIKNRKAYAFHIKGKAINNFNELYKKADDRGVNAVLYYKKHPLRSIKREVRFRYLWYDKLIFFKDWMDRNLSKSSFPEKANLFSNLLIKFYLVHAYAKGLRKGLKKYNLDLHRKLYL
ncbi:MAG: glycosyltransferase [Candidatus Aerophobetes bacterium]|nr:glycosyltransferase [Candidatus Aerophobetes bacterium]